MTAMVMTKKEMKNQTMYNLMRYIQMKMMKEMS
jgi:hypothetical protein